MKRMQYAAVLIVWVIGMLWGCGNAKTELSFQDIQHYPAATPEQSMEGSGMAGLMGGELTQLSTSDPFDSVVAFYSNELERYSPEILSHTSELGRQTAITVKQDKQVFTVAIQEHEDEERIMITHMAVGSR